MENKVLKSIGWVIICIGVMAIIFLRVWGIDLTEGQLLVRMLPWWLMAIGCLIGGAAIISNSKSA